MPFVKRSTAESALLELRSAYDASIAEAGVILVQQTSAGAETHHVSRSCVDILGWDPAAFLTPGTLRAIVHADDLGTFRTVATNPDSEAKVIRLRRADGTYGHFRFGVSDRGLDQPLGYALVDVSADATANRSRRRAAEVVARTERATVFLTLQDRDDPASLGITELNQAAERLFHNSNATHLSEVFSEQTRQLMQNAAFDVAHTGEDLRLSRLVVGELPELVLDVSLSRLADGTIAMQIDDVTLQTAVEQRLRERALHDQRSGLPNLASLEEQIAELERITPATVGLLAIELAADESGSLRDEARDASVIVEVAERLGATRPGSFVARIGEQRLVLVNRDLLGAEDLEVLAQTATAALAIPFEVNGAALSLHATVGAAMSAPLESRSRLLGDAEDALRRAIAQHRPWIIGTAEDRVAPSGLFHDVREGVGHGRMELRYQPVLELDSGRISKVEAVLRWADGDRQADESLELAERSGIPDVLPRWVVGEAAGAARWLADSGFDQGCGDQHRHRRGRRWLRGPPGSAHRGGPAHRGLPRGGGPGVGHDRGPPGGSRARRGPAPSGHEGDHRRLRSGLHLALGPLRARPRRPQDRPELHRHARLDPRGRGRGALDHRAVPRTGDPGDRTGGPRR
ncbi:MAG: diguanylate cyclase [Microthrixaceae bacterium]